MNKNKIVLNIVVIGVIVGVLFFYIGMKYGEKKSSALVTSNTFQGRSGMSGRTGGMRGGGGFTSGEIISKDDTSMTIKLQDGGSKIVFFTTTTPVMKMVAGTSNDVAIGTTVSITGKANPDGSVTADQIQIRPPQASQTPKTN